MCISTGETERKIAMRASVEIEGSVFEHLLTQNSHSVPHSPSPISRGRLKRPSRGPTKTELGISRESLPAEHSLEFETPRNLVHEREQEFQLALSGDREALDNLLASYMPQLYGVALRILGTPQDAEDALHDGLVRVLQHFREFEERSRFSTWLTRIVINAALMRLRHNRKQAMNVITSIDRPPGPGALPLSLSITDPGPNPEEMYAREEQFQILARKLQSFPAACRSALWLRDVQGMSTREAAETLAIPVGSLKSQLHRARLRLRKEVGVAEGTHKPMRISARAARRTGDRPSLKLTREVAPAA
jgi:RNA polymerase sigma-70 factor, ECF subfamily